MKLQQTWRKMMGRTSVHQETLFCLITFFQIPNLNLETCSDTKCGLAGLPFKACSSLYPLGIKAARSWSWQAPSGVKFKNSWNYTSTNPSAFNTLDFPFFWDVSSVSGQSELDVSNEHTVFIFENNSILQGSFPICGLASTYTNTTCVLRLSKRYSREFSSSETSCICYKNWIIPRTISPATPLQNSWHCQFTLPFDSHKE